MVFVEYVLFSGVCISSNTCALTTVTNCVPATAENKSAQMKAAVSNNFLFISSPLPIGIPWFVIKGFL